MLVHGGSCPEYGIQMNIYNYLSISLSIYHLSIHPSIHPSIIHLCLFIYLSIIHIYLSIYLSIIYHPSLSVYLSIHPSVYTSQETAVMLLTWSSTAMWLCATSPQITFKAKADEDNYNG